MTVMKRLLAVASSIVALAATQQQPLAETAVDQRCAKGADVRRIEIRFANDSGSLPCRVIYRSESENDTLGISSWRDISNLAACEARANQVVERLTDEGWTCAADLSAGKTRLDLAERLDRSDEPAVGLEAAGIDHDQGVDSAALPLNSQLAADQVAPDAGQEEDPPTRLINNPDIAPPPDELTASIEDDLNHLDITLDGLLEAQIAGYGDLNADDIDDALVLYTYTSPQPAFRQFLAIYMLDDGGYQLIATKPVAGSISATTDARIEAIDQGVIHLALQAYNPGDASCCPTGRKQLALTLRDLELVEIDADAPTR
ncbi:MAG: hypothetical protein AAGA21_18615 [Pseudomonadota bacterium]